jgi:hypothetical protein
MSGIFPESPTLPSSESEARPVCALIVPSHVTERDCIGLCKALPAGMPDYIEMHIAHRQGCVEKSTVVFYGERAYLIDFRIGS